ncbi:Methyltransferase domain-containing protein [Gillisia sp. Hel1_33_143]|nr:Methyltransferase domain-containing protein [Gillisia sp. Hel1_33_143]
MRKFLNTILPYKKRREIRKIFDKNLQSISKKLNYRYKFTGVYCPYCKNYFKQFDDFGATIRQNSQCPVCKSLERHRMIYLFLKEKGLVFENSKTIDLLHVAPEKCIYDKIKYSNHIEYFPLDLYPDYYYYLNGPTLIKGDVTDLQFIDEKFDFIFCNHVLEHIPDDNKAMSELFRVLKKDGSAVLLVPIDKQLLETYEDFSITDPKEREKAFGQDDHVRLYGKDYVNRLATAGFKVSAIDYWNTLSKRDRFKYGILENELIYFVEK